MNWFQVERFIFAQTALFLLHSVCRDPRLDTPICSMSGTGGQILPLATDSIFLLRYCMASDASHGPDLKLKKQFDPKFPRAQPLESYPLHEKQRTSLSRHPCFSVRNTYLLVSSRMCFAKRTVLLIVFCILCLLHSCTDSRVKQLGRSQIQHVSLVHNHFCDDMVH